MDFCGVWYDGYDPPIGTEVLSLTEEGKEMIEEMGIDNLAKSISIDMMANTEGTDTEQ